MLNYVYVLLILVILALIGVTVWYFYRNNSSDNQKTYFIPMRANVNRMMPSKLNMQKRTELRHQSESEEESSIIPKMSDFYSHDYDDKSKLNGMPESHVTRQVGSDTDVVVETEKKLLNMARAPQPYPQYSTISRGARLGNPFTGDLIIRPREKGISLPYNAEPSDLQRGFFSKF